MFSSQVKSVSLVLLRLDRAWDHIDGPETITIKFKEGFKGTEDANWVIVAMFQVVEQLEAVIGKLSSRRQQNLSYQQTWRIGRKKQD